MNKTAKLGALGQGVFCCHCQMAVLGWQGGTIHQVEKIMKQARSGELVLRAYEAAHKVWMNTSSFSTAWPIAKHALYVARTHYTRTMKAIHPNWIIF